MCQMKIAYIGLRAVGQGSGGVEKAVEEVAVRMAERGHKVTVFCRARYNPGSPGTFKNVRLVNLPAIYTKHMEAISHTFLAAWCCLAGYDLVHIHATGPSLMAFLPRLAGRKVVVTVHGLDWKRAKWRGPAKWILRAGAWTAVHFAHHTIVVSKALERHYRERGEGPVTWIPNGVNPVPRRMQQTVENPGLPSGSYLLYLGRLVPEKGCHYLVEAYRKLDTELHLVIAGGGTHTEDYVESLRTYAGGDDHIHFVGEVFGEEKEALYSNAAAFVFPSDLEGMPLVLLEALSFACPVICSDIPENMEVIQGENQEESPYVSLFKAGDVDDLVRRLQHFINDPEPLRRKGTEAAAFVADRYTWESVADQTEEVYASLMGGVR